MVFPKEAWVIESLARKVRCDTSNSFDRDIAYSSSCLFQYYSTQPDAAALIWVPYYFASISVRPLNSLSQLPSELFSPLRNSSETETESSSIRRQIYASPESLAHQIIVIRWFAGCKIKVITSWPFTQQTPIISFLSCSSHSWDNIGRCLKKVVDLIHILNSLLNFPSTIK